MLESFALKVAGVFIDIGFDRGANYLKRKFTKELSIEELKHRTQILFVDDESFEERISLIRDTGWNCRQIYDIHNPDSEDIKNADIIFMDYKGVGNKLTPTDEGIGLAKILKKKYPKKQIIFYSGFAGFIPGNEVFLHVDGWLQKHADTFEFIDQIENSARNIYGK